MEQLIQILQLKNEGVSIREIARRMAVSRNAVKKYLRRLENSNDVDKAPTINLKGEQVAAVEHVLTTKNRVSIIRGGAGTGKTTLIKEN